MIYIVILGFETNTGVESTYTVFQDKEKAIKYKDGIVKQIFKDFEYSDAESKQVLKQSTENKIVGIDNEWFITIEEGELL